MKRKEIFTLLLVWLCSASALCAQNEIPLAGQWGFRIDRDDAGVREGWYRRPLQGGDSIALPGSMPQRLKGDEVNARTRFTGSMYDSSYYYSPALERYRRQGEIKFPFFLTPDRHYVGTAWYEREVEIPPHWSGRHIELYLERPHIESTLWVDGKRVGSCNSLSTAHRYDLSSLKRGRHRLTLRIENRLKEEYNVGQDSHSVTDQTQGNWNGIVGRMALVATPQCRIAGMQVYPDLAAKKAVVKMQLAGSGRATLSLSAESFNSATRHRVPPVSRTLQVGRDTVVMELPMGDAMLTWDEFSPALYRLTATLAQRGDTATEETEFGMREISVVGKGIYVNGRRTLMRGTVENCDFPLTGYAPTDIESWMRLFTICKRYGLNHVRFHSYCPPQAAFAAADRVGLYLQPEGPSWPNHGSSLGDGRPIDRYLMEETRAIVRDYGNHASFCMLACGNEPYGNWVSWVSQFVDYWRTADPRRIYTGASVGGGWAWQPRNQYHVKAGARGLDWDRKRPESRSDYAKNIERANEPWISHETGQWCVFPNFGETEKYTGVNKARNFEIFRDLLNQNGMSEMAPHFTYASGKLQALCYKHEIEKTLRTPDYAGFQLLALNDYSGQGTALVGVLDVFFDEKGYIGAEEFTRFCNSTVPLMRTDKFVYTNDQTLVADVEVSHFGRQPLNAAVAHYRLTDRWGSLLCEGSLPAARVPIGNCTPLGRIELPLSGIERAEQLNLEVSLTADNDRTRYTNDWDFWVFPATVQCYQGDVYVTDTLDARAIERLQQGGKVLIAAAGKITYGAEVQQYFTPVFWNTSWFKMRPPHTTGIYVNPHHPLFGQFPTECSSNFQWWELLNRAQVMQFSEFPPEFRPTVQSIDTWFFSRKLGMLFEARVLNGRLMMTSMDISSRLDERVAARQMRKAILDYMNSDDFRPACEVSPRTVGELFTRRAPEAKTYTTGTPDELKPKQGED